MDDIEKALLNEIQVGFPIVSRPYAFLANKIGLTEQDVITILLRLKQNNGVIRQMSAIFDTKTLGYKSSLVATKVMENSVEEAAALINQHPGVSHNYKRNSDFNIWYTIAVPPEDDLEKTVDRLHKKTNAISTRILPNLTLYKIGVNLEMDDAKSPATAGDEHRAFTEKDRNLHFVVTEEDKKAIRELQKDIELIPEPFKKMAQRIGMTEKELFEKANYFQQERAMRRFAAVLRHQKAGYTANGMGVWLIPEGRDHDEIGYTMAKFKAVSHCYRRPTYEDWPYSIFSMIHARTVADCETIAEEIAKETGLKDYKLLFSTKEFKKTRVQYFVEEEVPV